MKDLDEYGCLCCNEEFYISNYITVNYCPNCGSDSSEVSLIEDENVYEE